MKTAIGLYDEKSTAKQVQQELIDAGFDKNQIRITDTATAKSTLIEAGVSDNDADAYAEGIRRGGTLVTVAVEDNRAEKAVQIMNRYSPIDIHQRASQWRTEGWSAQESTHKVEGEETIPIVEENIDIDKRQVEGGGVRVSSHMSEVPVEEEVSLRKEHVEVERRAVNRPASAADLDTFKEGTIEMTETSEEAVVTKEARVVEEVVVSKDVEQVTQMIRDTIRHTEVDVKQIPAESHKQFRTHYDSNYTSSKLDYDSHYEPAYSYGYTLGNTESLRDSRWEDIEPQVRQRWEESDNDSLWDDIKDAVRQGWNSVRT